MRVQFNSGITVIEQLFSKCTKEDELFGPGAVENKLAHTISYTFFF